MSRSMLRLWAMVLVALTGLTMARPTPAAAQRVDVNLFYTELAPHGRWFQHGRYGYVWTPRISEPDWRPYTRGRWAWTDEHGWYWVSSESWGWAPYHYGRWVLDDDYGWVWVPGTEWGPAWVSWRQSDDYIGWAPLPPAATWGAGGLAFNVSYYDGPRWNPVWCFVAPRYMGVSVGIGHHILPYRQNVTIIHRTRIINNYVVVNNRIVNRGIDVRHVERFGKHRVTALRVVSVDNHQKFGAKGGNVIHAFRPDVGKGSGNVRPANVIDAQELKRERLPGHAFTAKGGGDRPGEPVKVPRDDRAVGQPGKVGAGGGAGGNVDLDGKRKLRQGPDADRPQGGPNVLGRGAGQGGGQGAGQGPGPGPGFAKGAGGAGGPGPGSGQGAGPGSGPGPGFAKGAGGAGGPGPGSGQGAGPRSGPGAGMGKGPGGPGQTAAQGQGANQGPVQGKNGKTPPARKQPDGERERPMQPR